MPSGISYYYYVVSSITQNSIKLQEVKIQKYFKQVHSRE